MPLIGTVGSNNVVNNAGATSIGTTFNTAISTGKTIIGTVGSENGPSGTPSLTITDTKGNSYTVDKQIINGTTLTVSVFSGRVTNALTTSDSITVTCTQTRTRWVLTVQAFDDVTTSPVDKSATATGSSTTPSSGTTAVTSTANQLVYAGFCMGVRAFTAGSGYTASAQVATAAGGTDRAINSEWKYITATGAQTATGTLASSTTWAGAVVTYKVSAANQAPTANAGPDQAVTISSTVTLDGTGSSDPDGTITGYSWTQISGPSVTLSSNTVAQPTFTAPSSPATLVFGLVVTDNAGTDSPQDTVTISVQDKIGYVAEAATGIKETSDTSFTFSFAKSVQIGHSLLMGIVVDDPAESSVSPVLAASDTQGNTYTVDALGYRDDTLGVAIISCYVEHALTTSDSITVTCTTVRSRWAASVAEFDNIHQNGLDVTANINGSSSTSLVSGTTPTSADQVEVVFASFGFGRGASQVFSAGTNYTQAGTQQSTTVSSSDRAVANEYRIYTAAKAHEATGTLSAASGYGGAIATYAADLIVDSLPTADAGPDQSVAAFDTVTLDGTGSTDTDGDVTGYSWTQTAGPTVTLSSATAAQPTFTAPGADGGTSVTFSLVVTDNLGEDSTNSSGVTITVSSAEQFIAQGGSWAAIQEFSASGGSWL